MTVLGAASFELRWVLALVLLLAGVSKAVSARTLPERIERYFALPVPGLVSVAAVLVMAEIAAGSALLIPGTARTGGVVAAGLFAVFCLAIGWNVARGRRFACGCGVGTEHMIGPALLCRNAVLFGGAVFVVLVGARGGSGSASQAVPLALVAATLVVSVFLMRPIRHVAPLGSRRGAHVGGREGRQVVPEAGR